MNARRAPRPVAALVLAAGRSSRMGRNKLIEPIDGEAMVRRVVRSVLASRASPVIVVTGHEAKRVEQALHGLAVSLVFNPDYANGLSTSLRAGLRVLPPEAEGALICLADMPGIEPEHLNRLIAAFGRSGPGAICVPVRDGRRGNPVLWDRAYFAEMTRLEGDTGARGLIAAHAGRVVEVPIGSDAIFADVDTEADLMRLGSA